MAERWRPVPGFKGIYEVSDMGRVKSLEKRGADGRILKEKILRARGQVTDKRPRVCLTKNGRRVWKLVYRLVLEAFVGPCPKGMETRHWPDRNPRNCKLVNLRWGTHRENAVDMIRHGRVNPNRLVDGRFSKKRIAA